MTARSVISRRMRASVGVWLLTMTVAPLFWLAITGGSATAANGQPPEIEAADLLFKWGNVERRAAGLPEFIRDPRLDAYASEWNDKRAFGQTGGDPRYAHRPDLNGIFAMGYTSNGENVAFADGAYTFAMHDFWRGSTKGHRQNMLAEGFTHVGVAVTCGAYGGRAMLFATVNFGGTTAPPTNAPANPAAASGTGPTSRDCASTTASSGKPAPTTTATTAPTTTTPATTATTASTGPTTTATLSATTTATAPTPTTSASADDPTPTTTSLDPSGSTSTAATTDTSTTANRAITSTTATADGLVAIDTDDGGGGSSTSPLLIGGAVALAGGVAAGAVTLLRRGSI